MTGTIANVLSFYIAYIIFQFNSLGWKIFKPHRWVTFVVFFWGVVSTLQAACTSWSGLMACRFFLGVAETMFGPGIPLYFSFFYPRQYMGLRFGIFLSGAALASAYGGTLAYGLSHINSSIGNWQLLFIIEGAPTAILALVCWFFMPDSPATAKFLTPREREIATRLVGENQDQAQAQREEPGQTGLKLGNLLEAFKDYRSRFHKTMVHLEDRVANHLHQTGCSAFQISPPTSRLLLFHCSSRQLSANSARSASLHPTAYQPLPTSSASSSSSASRSSRTATKSEDHSLLSLLRSRRSDISSWALPPRLQPGTLAAS